MQPQIGFIGQGYIGKNYADDFERRGFSTVRYALEEPYNGNKKKITDCDIVFIAVPTPTTPEGFDDHIIREAIALVGIGKIAVIKSTILPGLTKSFQKQYPDRIVLYSPEFLSEATAAEDAAHPFSNIIGKPLQERAHERAANTVHEILPHAPFTLTCDSTEAEIIKYTHNASGYTQIILFNMMYDLARGVGALWEPIEKALDADPLICNRYAHPIHKSGRGAGGHCFIKDVEALSRLYRETIDDQKGTAVLSALIQKNLELLKGSGKDLDLVEGVYSNTNVSESDALPPGR
ncbi:hypothetical protein A3D62_00300 [Candidatus Kaiserbacteria bacterium RIFCSPHIGHO2_02_FULL_49_11]|uniref:UDP-glucose/GDP-mannose dehydrogenase dimerisation domain-containing protein n=1 Tax=Candidatus Kaiserbacteria bacterium RIFCSPHIGHO2_02_FULL_49_11 TaxID=1798489 RepID=A0A1F6D1Q6_9BACT|nr:MAG: hypothetical protein A3D62_00300 [Candidatus Kaiserbacteria bacterium RIFCSPHIGHO2_02_FULL_49_11]